MGLENNFVRETPEGDDADIDALFDKILPPAEVLATKELAELKKTLEIALGNVDKPMFRGDVLNRKIIELQKRIREKEQDRDLKRAA